MNRSHLRTFTFILAGATFLSGCQTLGPAIGIKPGAAATKPAGPGVKPGAGNVAVTAQPLPAALAAEQNSLKEGIELYNKGSFNDAIKRLNTTEVSNGSRPTQLTALKYTAFSYCVTSRQTLCRQAFEKAFKLDPGFDLAQGEHGHPLWGPAFSRARKSAK